MMRVLFAGSPAIAVPALEALAAMSGGAEGITLAGLLTNPDSPKGRSAKPEPTECARVLQSSAVPVFKLERLDGAAREQIAALKPDILAAFAYGKIFGPRFLSLFPLGGVNIHPSLLPLYRGPTPIPAAIINRDTITGISIQRLALEMDCGDILVQETIPLNGRETTAALSRIMANKAAELLPAALRGMADGTLRPRPQDHSAATYCFLQEKKEGLIEWKRSAVEIDARIRAFDPWPLSWTMHGEFQLFILKAKVLENEGPFSGDTGILPGQVLGKDKNNGILIQTGYGILAVQELQYQTKKALEWRDFLNGTHNFIGTRLG